jgi:hypothetical protein
VLVVLVQYLSKSVPTPFGGPHLKKAANTKEVTLTDFFQKPSKNLL